MKRAFLQIICVAIFISCVPINYYQVYSVAPIEKVERTETALKFEDENCIVSYNLWAEGGDVGFLFYNKTNESIYLNMKECFFVLNGVANDYYLNRIYENSSSSSESLTSFSSSPKELLLNRQTGFKISYIENEIICIPSKSSKIITEYQINNTLFRDCELLKFPSNKNISSLFFTEQSSPFVFGNRLSYSLGETKVRVYMENNFYISEIVNYPENSIVESKYDEFCGEKNLTLIKVFKKVSPDKFFIMYRNEK